jgi:ABC-type sugar transport system substrate-binding protein
MKKHRIILSLITVDNDFQLEQAAAAEEAARRLGADIEVVFADGDSIEQSEQVLRFVQAKPDERPDGIIFEPVGGPALAVVARAAVDAGIGWVVLNKEVEYLRGLRQGTRVPVFAVTSDHLEMGRIQGHQLAALMPDGGSILSIQGPAESDACRLRVAGLAETKPSNIRMKTMRASWTESSALKSVNSWLQLSTSRHEPMAAVAAQNDAMAMGAKKAFEEFARAAGGHYWDELPFLGMDGVPATGQAWVKAHLMAATIVAPPPAGTAVEFLVAALRRGEIVPETTVLAPYSFPPLPTIKPLSAKRRMVTVGHM